ncbi:MAG: hypothetical protein JO337_10360 [Acidimicrobiales bacterium]|nr:hypothetical protein [Acidimicrobiales bacterium]
MGATTKAGSQANPGGQGGAGLTGAADATTPAPTPTPTTGSCPATLTSSLARTGAAPSRLALWLVALAGMALGAVDTALGGLLRRRYAFQIHLSRRP